MPTSIDSGTLTADGTEQTIKADTSNKNYVLAVDTVNMVNGEVVELRIYTTVGLASRVAYYAVYANAQAHPIKFSVPVPATAAMGITCTLKQTTYVSAYKAFAWYLLSVT